MSGNIPAVAYYRMSSDRQEMSIPGQVKAVEKYAADNGYRIIRDYRDEGISGDDTAKRLEFKRMVLDAAKRDFRAVLAWDQDRIGRFDPIEAGYWLTPLRDAGAQLVTVNQGKIDLDDFAGQIVFSVTQAGKHSFLKDMAKAVARGKYLAAESGQWVSGSGPLGYRVEDGRLVVDPIEADIVRKIFADYDAGYSLWAVADRLNTAGIVPTLKRRFPTHKRACDQWRAQVIKPILENVAYLGTFRYNVIQRGKYARVREGMVTAVRRGESFTRDDAHAIVIDSAHEAIIEREQFERVNAKLSANRKRTSRTDQPNALTGICWCGFCGGRMVYNSQRYKGRQFRYLACNHHQTNGGSWCQRRTIREEKIVPVIVGTIRERLLAPNNAQRLRSALERLCRDKKAPRELDRLKRELVVLDDDIAKARRRVVEVDSDMIGIVQDHLRELRRRHEELTDRLSELEWRAGAGADDIDATVSRAMDSANEVVDRLSRTDPRMLREALRETVERVDVFVEGRVIKKRSLYHLDRGRIMLRSDSGFMPLVADTKALATTHVIEFSAEDVARFAA